MDLQQRAQLRSPRADGPASPRRHDAAVPEPDGSLPSQLALRSSTRDRRTNPPFAGIDESSGNLCHVPSAWVPLRPWTGPDDIPVVKVAGSARRPSELASAGASRSPRQGRPRISSDEGPHTIPAAAAQQRKMAGDPRPNNRPALISGCYGRGNGVLGSVPRQSQSRRGPTSPSNAFPRGKGALLSSQGARSSCGMPR